MLKKLPDLSFKNEQDIGDSKKHGLLFTDHQGHCFRVLHSIFPPDSRHSLTLSSFLLHCCRFRCDRGSGPGQPDSSSL